MPKVSRNSVDIYFEVYGSGPPLVLMHGMFQSADLWKEEGYVERLAAHYELILIDARGHGRSDKPTKPEDYTIENFANDVILVLDALNITTAHFLGYSMGGRIGLGLAMYFPERLRSLIIGGSSPMDGASRTFPRPVVATRSDVVFAIEQFTGEVMEVEAFIGGESESITAYAAILSPDWPDLASLAGKVPFPLAFFVGASDRRFSDVARFQKLNPGSRLCILEGADHNSALHQVRKITDMVLEFHVQLGDICTGDPL